MVQFVQKLNRRNDIKSINIIKRVVKRAAKSINDESGITKNVYFLSFFKLKYIYRVHTIFTVELL